MKKTSIVFLVLINGIQLYCMEDPKKISSPRALRNAHSTEDLVTNFKRSSKIRLPCIHEIYADPEEEKALSFFNLPVSDPLLKSINSSKTLKIFLKQARTYADSIKITKRHERIEKLKNSLITASESTINKLVVFYNILKPAELSEKTFKDKCTLLFNGKSPESTFNSDDNTEQITYDLVEDLHSNITLHDQALKRLECSLDGALKALLLLQYHKCAAPHFIFKSRQKYIALCVEFENQRPTYLEDPGYRTAVKNNFRKWRQELSIPSGHKK